MCWIFPLYITIILFVPLNHIVNRINFGTFIKVKVAKKNKNDAATQKLEYKNTNASNTIRIMKTSFIVTLASLDEKKLKFRAYLCMATVCESVGSTL